MGLFTRRYFETVDEAKEFLISKVGLEASLQGKALNEHEKRALNYASDEPSTEWDLDWDRVRYTALNDEGAEFEREMIAIFKAAWDRDKQQNSSDFPKYKSALNMLKRYGSTNWIVFIAVQVLKPSDKSKLLRSTLQR